MTLSFSNLCLSIINRCLGALAEVELIGADIEPIVRALIEVEASAECNDPAVVEFHAAVVQCVAHFNF